jgi:20S proteasome subunit beta 7
MLTTRMAHIPSQNGPTMAQRIPSPKAFNIHSEYSQLCLRYFHAHKGANEFRQPIVTGTSVLAIKYKDGIMMAADNLGEHPIILIMNLV